MKTLLIGGIVVGMDPAVGGLHRGDVLIEDGVIVEVTERVDAPDAEVIDAATFSSRAPAHRWRRDAAPGRRVARTVCRGTWTGEFAPVRGHVYADGRAAQPLRTSPGSSPTLTARYGPGRVLPGAGPARDERTMPPPTDTIPLTLLSRTARCRRRRPQLCGQGRDHPSGISRDGVILASERSRGVID